jgi:hypothetical protein
MAVTAGLFGHFASNVLGGMTEPETSRRIDILTDAIRVMLCTSAYVPDPDNHKFKASVTNELPAAGGYVAGGVTLVGKTLTYTAAGNILVFDASDAVWAASTLANARIAVIYDDRAAAAADKELIGYIDFGADMSSAGVDFRIVWNAGGIFKITVAAAA